jgi:transcriptional regulator with XRE-family HTH domain
MGIKEKIKNAKRNDWLREGLSDSELKSILELAQISSKIERRRIEMGMTQKEFADFMGVTQGMVSKWESREYNFTVKTLNDICAKIGLEFYPSINHKITRENFVLIQSHSQNNYVPSKKSLDWATKMKNRKEGAIA